ncbi:hypothetical protein [Streptomyces luteogriseus]|uniref:hypothetical protein n=1 Tax=Streptomyces luteogriseus TaxID=68233 RepID=UPI003724367C
MRLTVRHLIRGAGRHRAGRPYAALVDQTFVNCPTCGVETAATRHGRALLCAEGHTITPGATA